MNINDLLQTIGGILILLIVPLGLIDIWFDLPISSYKLWGTYILVLFLIFILDKFTEK